jgi:hypothetical protein
MNRRQKHPMTAADQAVYNKWSLGVGAIYGTIALVLIVAVAVAHYSSSDATARVTASSSPSPR